MGAAGSQLVMRALARELFLRDEHFPFPLSVTNWWLTILGVPVALVGCFVDASLLYVFARNRTLWSRCNVLIMMGLILSQLIFCGTTAGYYIYNVKYGAFVSAFECRVEALLALCSGSASVGATSAIALERYYSIVKQNPLRNKDVVALLCAVWSVGLFIGCFPLFAGTIALRPTGLTCTSAWSSRLPISLVYSSLCFAFLGGMMFITCMVYLKTFLVVQAASQTLHGLIKSRAAGTTIKVDGDMENPETEDKENGTRHKRWSRMVFATGRFLFVTAESEHSTSGRGPKSSDVAPVERKHSLERAVFRRSMRIVVIFMLCWAFHTFMFIWGIIPCDNRIRSIHALNSTL
ncbi:hypothetical protein DFS34DRAFT_614768 [Phlyctochytrium arcticum]|nr:hypothetical protein DFS34DRAFT_614768 [Phlyctochytrium arcticum]